MFISGESRRTLFISSLLFSAQISPGYRYLDNWFLASTKLFQKRDFGMAAYIEYGLRSAMSLLMPDGSGYGDVTDAEYRAL